MNALEENTRLVEHDPRLEESAIRNMIRAVVNEATKREVQRCYLKTS